MQQPKFNPVNAKKRVGPLLLPAGGRKGPTPMWPLPGSATPDELVHWARLWGKPQAVVWEDQEIFEVVARYCRIVIASVQADATAALMGQATALEDRLGLTPKSMRMMLWQIAPDEVADRRDENAVSARERMKAV